MSSGAIIGSALAGLLASGLFARDRRQVIVIDEDPRDAFERLTSPPASLSHSEPRAPWLLLEPREHCSTPAPLTKRQRRRARGRG